MTIRCAALLGLLALPLVCADSAQFRIHHRLYHPSEEQGGFSERGVVSIAPDNTVSFQIAPTFAEDIASFAEDLHAAKDRHLMLYQVALEREGDLSEAQWDVSSVKACHLSGASAESIYLHAVDTQSPKPYAINYFVSPIPHDGACPKSRSKKSSKKLTFDSFVNVNTTVILKGSHFPPLPPLVAPPLVTAQGDPVVPIEEKTFIQKYWLYIVGLLLATMLMGGGEEERPRK